MARNDPLRNMRFRVEIDQITQAFFSEVAIGDTTTEAIDYREATEPRGEHPLLQQRIFRGYAHRSGRSTPGWPRGSIAAPHHSLVGPTSRAQIAIASAKFMPAPPTSAAPGHYRNSDGVRMTLKRSAACRR